jgi:uncharacterized protein (TIGR02996 family)
MASEQLLVFLREIRRRPDDDTPRLILADWLQDQGDPRGELLHHQLVRSRLPAGDPRCEDLLRLERALIARHVWAWLGPLVDLAGRWDFHRGLIRLEARAERLLAEPWGASACEDVLVWVEELRLHDARPQHLARLAHSPLLGWLSTLDLTDNRIADAGLARLLASPFLGTLAVLRLAGNRIGGRGAADLAGCAALARLEVLDLAGNRIGDAGAAALAASANLGGLRTLVVSGNGLGPQGLTPLRERFGARLAIAPPAPAGP